MSARTDKYIKLNNDLTMGYSEFGDPTGKPIIHLHGWPSSRLELDNPDLIAIAERMHIRLIAPDRPGIGLSTWRPFTITGYPDLLAEFADKLGLDHFPILGFSSGGKFVAACAWKIPQRLTAATIVSGSAPFDLPGAREALSKEDLQLYGAADKMPWLFRLMLWKIARDARNNPASILALFADMAESDKAVLAQPNVKHTMEQMVIEAFRQGTRSTAHEGTIEARPWGFSLSEIKIPVNLWHGEEDKVVSIKHAHILAAAMPNARPKYFSNIGHLLVVKHFEEVLNAAIG